MIHRLHLATAPLEAHLTSATDAEEVWLTLDVLAILGFVARKAIPPSMRPLTS
jgi:hypothetical protein